MKSLLILISLLLLQVCSTVALPQKDSYAAQLARYRKGINVNKNFCSNWLHGITPTQATVFVTSTTSREITSTATSTTTKTENVDTTLSYTNTLVPTETETAIASTTTLTISSTTVLTSTRYTLASAAPTRRSNAFEKRQDARYGDKVITQACLYRLYGTNSYPTTTSTKTITLTNVAVTTNVLTATVTSTSTLSSTNTITNAVTQTFTPLPLTITSNLPIVTSTVTSTSIVPIPTSCSLQVNTLTCTYKPSNVYNGLVTNFVAPCTGQMKVQLDGGHGGNSYNNGGSTPGYSIQSQIKVPSLGDEIPFGTTFDIYIGGNGYSQYYDKRNDGGFNGGGRGDTQGLSKLSSSGGGGATDIRYQQMRLAVAGGGGGNGGSTGGAGYGNRRLPFLFTKDANGQDATDIGRGGGGGGYLGGQQGMMLYPGKDYQTGEGGYSGSNLADTVLGYAPHSGQAIVTFTCSL